MIREKYVEERFPRWFEFGIHPGTNLIDLADTKGDLFTKIDPVVAKKLIAAREKFVDALVEVFNEHPDALFCSEQGVR